MVRNLTPIIFNIFTYLLNSILCSQSPGLPDPCPTQMSSLCGLWPLWGHHPAWITSLYCLWTAFPSCPSSSCPHGPWLPLDCRKEGLVFKCWPSNSSLRKKKTSWVNQNLISRPDLRLMGPLIWTIRRKYWKIVIRDEYGLLNMDFSENHKIFLG